MMPGRSIVSRRLGLAAAVVAGLGLAGCASYSPGDPNPNYPHVISAGGGLTDEWKPAPGYTWVNPNAEADLRVRWVPGTGYWYLGKLKWPHVIAGYREGTWYPAPGYAWAHLDASGHVSPGDLTVAWREGLPYMQNGSVSKPHLLSAKEEGQWMPEPGYTWVNPSAQADLRVRWVPGAGYWYSHQLRWPHIHAADQEGSWMPDSGYAWAHVGSDGRVTDFAVYSLREAEAYRARRRALDKRWLAYLKQIQTQHDYPNWSSPPYDLYRQTHR
jgi:hypothetical protein